jgi:hypothetical protein
VALEDPSRATSRAILLRYLKLSTMVLATLYTRTVSPSMR